MELSEGLQAGTLEQRGRMARLYCGLLLAPAHLAAVGIDGRPVCERPIGDGEDGRRFYETVLRIVPAHTQLGTVRTRVPEEDLRTKDALFRLRFGTPSTGSAVVLLAEHFRAHPEHLPYDFSALLPLELKCEVVRRLIERLYDDRAARSTARRAMALAAACRAWRDAVEHELAGTPRLRVARVVAELISCTGPVSEIILRPRHGPPLQMGANRGMCGGKRGTMRRIAGPPAWNDRTEPVHAEPELARWLVENPEVLINVEADAPVFFAFYIGRLETAMRAVGLPSPVLTSGDGLLPYCELAGFAEWEANFRARPLLLLLAASMGLHPFD